MIATRLLVAACLLPMVIAASADEKFDTRTASFAVTFHDETSAYRDAAVIVLPGASVVFQTVGGPPGDYAAVTTDGTRWCGGAAPVEMDGAGSAGHLPDHLRRPGQEGCDRLRCTGS